MSRPPGILPGDLQDWRIAGYHPPLGVTRTQAVTLRGVRLRSGFTFVQRAGHAGPQFAIAPRLDESGLPEFAWRVLAGLHFPSILPRVCLWCRHGTGATGGWAFVVSINAS
jgi:hypothetical protein